MNKYLIKAFAALGGIALIASAWVFVPPPRHASAQFVDQSTYAGGSVGAVNAHIITIGNYTAHTAGVVLRFIPGGTNTGPTTINVSGLGNVAIVRPSSIGNVALSGGELQVNELTCIVYNGTAYQLACNVDMRPIGDTVEYRGAALPRGTLIEDGSPVSRTTYAPLFSVIGTTYGAGDGSTTFNLPLSNGTAFAALDNQGVVTANRLTSAGSGCNATAVGLCGSQNQTLTNLQVPPLPYTDPGHVHTVTVGTNGTPLSAFSGGGGVGYGAGANANGNLFGAPSGITLNGAVTGITINPGGGAAHPIVMPVLIGRRAIKY